jgi:aspartate racemase
MSSYLPDDADRSTLGGRRESPYNSPAFANKGSSPSVIGIVGGVGPLAGLDLQSKIISQTVAARDQDHLPMISISWPGSIPDRTEYLLGRLAENPAYPILEQLRSLANAGVTVAGIPCNTAHAPAIFDVIRAGVAEFERPLRLLHMIEETAATIRMHYPELPAIGVLSTTGTWQTRLYPSVLEPLGFHVVVPDESLQVETIHPAVYDPDYGIKATGQVSKRARADLERGIEWLRKRGAEAIILGCTEIPLAFPEGEFNGLPLIDPTMALARALIREIDPARLK